jgi:hypothetical protein
MRDVKLINKEGFYWVEDMGNRTTGLCIDPIEAISEWEYFERLNTNSEPYRRFLKHVISLREIEETVNKLKNDI